MRYEIGMGITRERNAFIDFKKENFLLKRELPQCFPFFAMDCTMKSFRHNFIKYPNILCEVALSPLCHCGY